MTTYTTHADAIFDVDAPILGATHLEARDNLIAVAEGDPTAPSILEGAIAGSAVGGVGTYALLFVLAGGSAGFAPGATFAGSSLEYAGFNVNASGGTPSLHGNGANPSGTWRAMGFGPLGAAGDDSCTLFLRIV